jgi:hypothetical protein
MPRLPVPGNDIGTWGEILNDFLKQIHNTDGTLKPNIVGPTQLKDNSVTASSIADGSITEALLDTNIRAKLDAASSDWNTISNKPAVIAAGADQASARTAIGAGTASTKADVGLGNVDNTSDVNKPISTATQTALNNKAALVHTHVSSQISDATTTGVSLLTASDATAARAAIGAGTSNLIIGTTNATAKAGDYQPAAANISDSTATGRSLLTAVDAAAAKTT